MTLHSRKLLLERESSGVVTPPLRNEEFLEDILVELRVINAHLALITGDVIKHADIYPESD